MQKKTTTITTKKIQLFPVGDKEERDRVYQYLRDGIYNQYCILNTYMSQVGCLYYKYDKNFNDPNFKEEMKMIFRNTNTAIYDMKQAKGLGMAGNCGMKVKQDFSTALKNGLAKGERNLPFYKRDFPLMVPSRFITIYTWDDTYTTDDGTEKTVNAYFFKFVNGIHFKLYLGAGKNKGPDKFLPSLLESIVTDPEHYKVCGSTIQITNKGKIIFNLSVKIEHDVEEYVPEHGKIMGLALGYDKCLVAALSTDDNEYEIGGSIKNDLVAKRKDIQIHFENLQRALKYSNGGHGRGKKLAKLETHKSYEKNYVQTYNHNLSKMVVEFAKDNKVSAIVIEDVTKSDLDDYPVLLRNWSYYQLVQFITYKAEREGIVVTTSKMTDKQDKKTDVLRTVRNVCSSCGEVFCTEEVIPKVFEWTQEVSFTCPHCGKTISHAYNKAKNMTIMG